MTNPDKPRWASWTAPEVVLPVGGDDPAPRRSERKPKRGSLPFDRAELNAAIREGLDRLDGTPESSVALLAGVDRERIEEYGGMPEGEG